MTLLRQLKTFFLDMATKICAWLWYNVSKRDFEYFGKLMLVIISLSCITMCDSDAPAATKPMMKNESHIITKTASNFMNLKKHLLHEGFDEQNIAKLVQNIAQIIGWEWYDQKARIQIQFETHNGRKYATRVEFMGMGKVINVNYKDPLEKLGQNSDTNNSIESQLDKNGSSKRKQLVVMKGFVNTTLERMILNSEDVPHALRRNVLRFARDARISGNKGDKFACLYDPQDYSILAMNIGNESAKKTAILFHSKSGKKLFSHEGVALLGEKLVFHMPVHGRLSGFFGYRMHPVLKVYRFHYGIDIAASSGTPIAAAASGTVIFAGRLGGYGNCIKIQHGHITTLYAHLSNISSAIYVGKYVNAKEIIGKVGRTGLASGPHLHYEIWVHGKKVNPLKFAQETHQKLKGDEMTVFREYAQKIVSYF